MSKYDVQAIRNKLKSTMTGRFNDPDEFKPEKAASTTDPIKYRFFILPPLFKGDELKSGEVNKSMDQFFISHANHWINDKPHPCPRVWDGSECPVCKFGFDLLKEEENQRDEDKRRKIIRQWMPTTYHMVNIFFSTWKGNPEDLRGKVKFYNASKTLFDQWTSTLMRDDVGDPDDPQAYGVFFDENAAFTYELQVLKQGRQNSYKTSKFLPNGGKPTPMITAKSKKEQEEILTKLLRNRHNLWDKINQPDIEKLNSVFSVMTNGDDEPDDGGFSSRSGFDEDEVTNNKPTVVSDSITDDDDLSDESPMEEEKGSLVSANASSDDDDSNEIDDLLSQLDDD